MSDLDKWVDESLEDFRRRVRDMKRIEGMSYAELAELCEIGRITLSEFINGKDSRIKTVLKISIGTGINI